MFSKTITNSARFIKMPVDSQLLYFHLGLHADDDGIVEAYTILKMLGNSEDNLHVLVAKGFIKVLNSDLVSFITDWNEHNLIRADRKIDSIYKHLLLQLVPSAKILEAKPRSDVKDNSNRVSGPSTDGIGKVRLGKVRRDKKEEKKHTHLNFVKLTIEEHKKLITTYGEDIISTYIGKLNTYIGSKGKQYKSHYFALISWLDRDGTAKVTKKIKHIEQDLDGKDYFVYADGTRKLRYKEAKGEKQFDINLKGVCNG